MMSIDPKEHPAHMVVKCPWSVGEIDRSQVIQQSPKVFSPEYLERRQYTVRCSMPNGQ